MGSLRLLPSADFLETAVPTLRADLIDQSKKFCCAVSGSQWDCMHTLAFPWPSVELTELIDRQESRRKLVALTCLYLDPHLP